MILQDFLFTFFSFKYILNDEKSFYVVKFESPISKDL